MWNIVIGIFIACTIASVILVIRETKRAPLVDNKEPFLWDEK